MSEESLSLSGNQVNVGGQFCVSGSGCLQVSMSPW